MMATKPKAEQKASTETVEATESSPLFESIHKLILASIGAIALTQEELEKFIHKLIERGEIAEKEGKKLMDEVLNRRKKDIGEAENEVTRRLSDLLKSMNIPTKSDVDNLNKKIAELNKKLDQTKTE
jgi:poly(hydroxyalkanoate) granule-associated protein